MRTWEIWNPKTNKTINRTQKTRPREHASAVVVGSWPVSDPPPDANDAQALDAWRARRGIACR